MGAADPQTAVTHGNDHFQIRPGHFDSGGISERPPMKAMKRMGVKKSIEQAGAADVANDNNIFSGKPHIRQSLVQAMKHLLVGAPGTEHGRAVAV
jgi:hypothetical protein